MKANSSLKLERNSLLQFLTKNSSRIAISFGSDYNILPNITNTIFLRLRIDNTLMWKNHIEIIIPKLSVACFAVRAIKHLATQSILKRIYHF